MGGERNGDGERKREREVSYGRESRREIPGNRQ
jgi:hypothetical protein